MRTQRPLAAAFLALALGLAACDGGGAPAERTPAESTPATAPAPAADPAAACAEHGVARCPFCHPSLLVSMGFCGGHGVPEAICTRCRGDLEATYRARGDWCGEHGLPESQCEACHPGALDVWKAGGASAPAGAGHAIGADAAAQASGADAAEPCAEHAVARCPFCFPDLMWDMGFCGGHGVPEAVCTRCRGDLEEAFRARGDWCGGHGLPESQCEACNPGALEKFEQYRTSRAQPAPAAPAGEEPAVSVDVAPTPRVLRAPSLTCSTDASTVRLADAELAGRIGLETEPVVRAKLRRTMEVPATVEYDARAYARLAPRAAGTVVEVLHDLGDRVEAGEPLVALDSAVLGAAQAEWLRASAQVDLWERNSARERELLERSLSTEQDFLQAETRLAEARIDRSAAAQRLQNLGLADARLEELAASGEPSSRLVVRAPFASTVVGLDAVLGELATPADALVSVADTSRMWVVLDVDQEDVRFVEVGRPVLLSVEGWRGETLGGKVTWISSHVDPRTRTVKVRSELANPEGHLRDQSFGTARLVTRDDEEAVFVPKGAVQWEGCCNVAFERVSPTEFVPRKLRLGYDTGEHYEVLRGLQGGETVVTQGSFLLKTELQKGSIGAGCCEVDHLAE